MFGMIAIGLYVIVLAVGSSVTMYICAEKKTRELRIEVNHFHLPSVLVLLVMASVLYGLAAHLAWHTWWISLGLGFLAATIFAIVFCITQILGTVATTPLRRM